MESPRGRSPRRLWGGFGKPVLWRTEFFARHHSSKFKKLVDHRYSSSLRSSSKKKSVSKNMANTFAWLFVTLLAVSVTSAGAALQHFDCGMFFSHYALSLPCPRRCWNIPQMSVSPSNLCCQKGRWLHINHRVFIIVSVIVKSNKRLLRLAEKDVCYKISASALVCSFKIGRADLIWCVQICILSFCPGPTTAPVTVHDVVLNPDPAVSGEEMSFAISATSGLDSIRTLSTHSSIPLPVNRKIDDSLTD